MSWNQPSGYTEIRYMFGLVDFMHPYSVRKFVSTSHETALSTLWQGVLGGEMLVSVVTVLGRDSLYVTTYVKVHNFGDSVLTDVHCKCLIPR